MRSNFASCHQQLLSGAQNILLYEQHNASVKGLPFDCIAQASVAMTWASVCNITKEKRRGKALI